MRFKKLLFFILAAYWAAFIVLLSMSDVSKFIDMEGVVYLVLLSMNLVFFMKYSERSSFPLFFIIANYSFYKYFLGAIKLGVLSDYGSDAWVLENYAWATTKEVNVWLRHGVLSTLFLSAGIFAVDRLYAGKVRKRLVDLDREPMNVPLGYLFITLAAVFLYSAWLFSKSGYGLMSGIEFDAMWNLYGVINMEPALLVTLAVLVFQWEFLEKSNRLLFGALLLAFVVFRVLAGSRSFLQVPLTYFLIFVSYRKLNFVVRKRYILMAAALILINIALYPLALALKNAIKNNAVSGEAAGSSFLRLNAAVNGSAQVFFENKNGFVEILDRLSDMGAPLRIINDDFVVPPSDQFSIAKVVKRTINDMIPGDVFGDVLPSQQVYARIYFDQEAIYGGEEWGLSGIYYLLFGYAGSLLVVFATGVIVNYLWIRFALSRGAYRPIILAYVLNSFYCYIHNAMIEVWFIGAIFRPILTLSVIGAASAGMKVVVKSILPRRRMLPAAAQLGLPSRRSGE